MAMAPRTAAAEKTTRVRLAESSHYDQIVVGDRVFNRGDAPLVLSADDARRILAEHGTDLQED